MAQVNIERVSDYLTSCEEHLLNRIKSDEPKDLLINIHSLENMKFKWNKYKNEIKTYKPLHSFDDMEKMILKQHKAFFLKKRNKVIKEINSMVNYHIHAVKEAYRFLKSSSLKEKLDSIEFDEAVLDHRDSIEYSFNLLTKLGYKKTVESIKRRLERSDPLLKELSKEATSQYYENDIGYIAANPELFPKHFWWRLLAWESYLKHLKSHERLDI